MEGITFEIKEKLPKNPTICFATICKDEENCIRETLESVAPYISYWVVCDTGSTDKTCEIVEDFFKEKNIPGKLYHDKWVNFGHNKTLLFNRCYKKSDYIIHLDADDLLVGNFDFNAQDAGKISYYFRSIRDSTTFKALVLFNNHFKWKFCGAAHTIIKCLDNKHNLREGDLSHRNFYYMARGDVGQRNNDPEKYDKDAAILRKQFFNTLVDDPDNLNNRSVFYTAQSYYDAGKYLEATQWYSLYTKMKGGWIEEEFEANMRIAKCFMLMGRDPETVTKQMEKAIKIFPDRAEPLFSLGTYFNLRKQQEKAYKYLKRAKEKNWDHVKHKYCLFTNEKCYHKYINDELSVSCYWTNRAEEGYKYLTKIINDPDFQPQLERLSDNINHYHNKFPHLSQQGINFPIIVNAT